MDVDLNAWLLKVSEWLGVIAVTWLAGLSPRFKPKPLGFKYPRREGIISLSLFTIFLAGAFLFMNRIPPAENILGTLWQHLALAAAALSIIALALFGRGQPLRSVLWGREMFAPGIRLGLALAALTIFLQGKIMTLVDGVSAEEGYALVAWVGITLAEETIFRGYIQPRLSTWIGVRWGWLATAAMFVMWQLPSALQGANLWQVLALALIQGLILGWLAHRSGHLIAPWLYRIISEWLAFV
jgi:membrane protease YdiL (CAAX protease family)